MGVLKDAISAIRAVQAARKAGAEGNLAIVQEDELIDNRHWLAQRDWENQLMQKCLIDHITYQASPCEYCGDHAIGVCNNEQHGKRGCKDWYLRFLTEEELERCAQRATGEEKPAP